MSKSSAKQGPPAVGKKYKVKKVIEKPKPAQKSAAKKVVKAEKKANPGGISGKYTGLKEKKPKAAAAVKTDGPKTDAAKKPTGQKRSNGGNHGNAVVKISSLPHGFYEDQLKGYFTQFGTVTNVKVVRSLKTGRSKGVAFVEFSVPEVAEIAAETMNNYLLFKSLLKTEYIPPNKVKPGLFTKVVEVVTKPDGTTSVQSAVITKRKQEVRKLNAKPSEGQAKKRKNRLENQLKLKNKFLKKLGVDLDVKSLVEGQVDLTTPVKAPRTAAKAKKTQNITVKVSNDEPVAEKKEAAPKKAAPAKKSKPAPAEKKPTPVIVPKETKKAVEKQEAKQEEAKNQQKKNNKAKKAAKGKNAQDTVATPVTPEPVKKAPAEKKQKKVQEAPKSTEPAKKVAPAKAKKEAPVKPNKPVAKAPAAKKAPVKASPQKEKKVAPKKSLEKKKAVKLSPKKKSVK